MPHYFFNMRGDRFRIDEKGIDLPNVEAARSEAVQLVANMLTVDPGLLPFGGCWWIEVADDRSQSLFRIDISASEAHVEAHTTAALPH